MRGVMIMDCFCLVESKQVPHYLLPYEPLRLCQDQLAVEHLATRGF